LSADSRHLTGAIQVRTAVELDAWTLVDWLPPMCVVVVAHPEGHACGLKWRVTEDKQLSLHKIASGRGAFRTSLYYAFQQPVPMQALLDEIRRCAPNRRVIQHTIGEEPAEVLRGVEISLWDVSGTASACLIPCPLPLFANVGAIRTADLSKVLLSGEKPDQRVAMLFGAAAGINAVGRALQAQGAQVTDALAQRWGMGPASGGRCLTVRCTGWTVEVEADLRDPRHIALMLALRAARATAPFRWGMKSVPWDATFHTTRKDWPDVKRRCQETGLELHGDDPDAPRAAPLSFNPAAVGGWTAPAPNGLLLHPFQRDGVQFVMARRMRALIGDEMGTGKTAQAVAAADAGGARRIVVVGPASARYVWDREIQGWSRTGGAIQHLMASDDSLEPNARWHIVTFDLLAARAPSWRLNNAAEEAAFLRAFPGARRKIAGKRFPKRVTVDMPPAATPQFADAERDQAWRTMVEQHGRLTKEIAALEDFVLIVDEAHRVKNGEAKRSQSIARITETGCRVLLLTGTPLRNHEGEAASLLALIDPDTAAVLKPNRGYTTQDVRDCLAALMIRRTKAEVLPHLPPKTRQRIDLDVEESSAYETYQEKIAEARSAHQTALESGESEEAARKAALGPLESARKWLGLAKVDRGAVADFVTDVVENEGCCVVITAHHEVSERLVEQLKQAGLTAALVDGRTRQNARAQTVQQFQEGRLDVFVGSIHAAGESITLSRANSVVFVELDWVPAAMLQAEDRIHREGQSRHCEIFHLVARTPGENLDESMIAVVGAKLARIGAVLNESTENIIASEKQTKLEVVAHLLAQRRVPSLANFAIGSPLPS